MVTLFSNNSQKCLVVKLTNLFDDFSEILLLEPNFGLEELIVLIRFLYKTKYDQNNIKSLNLYNQEDLKDKIDLEKIKTLKDLYEITKAFQASFIMSLMS